MHLRTKLRGRALPTVALATVVIVVPLAAAGLAARSREATVLPSPLIAADAPTADGFINFSRDIRPILSNNCLKCHGPDEAAREANLRLDLRAEAIAPRRKGAAIVPGDHAASRAFIRITEENLDARMPPVEVNEHGLSEREIDLLTRWIDAGAEWSEHWSFVPPVQRELPDVENDAWAASPIDRWILARLEREGLKPEPEADRATLLRRVSLDLTGLPPTPEEVIAFERDESPDAYERAVDRLLASPRFGERWAAWWLDLARYADTKGYEKDDRRTMWPYRDWVIRAFNDNLSFASFTAQQLAGDMLPRATQDTLIATAFHRNTMTNDEGGTSDEEFRVAAVVDRVNTTYEVWQGLTMGCAQCHTHKYDPITHADYYRSFAIFNNTADADRPDEAPTIPLLTEEQQAEIDQLSMERVRLEREIYAYLEDVIAARGESLADLELVPDAWPEPKDQPWFDDLLPAGANGFRDAQPIDWPWTAGSDGARAPSGARYFTHEAKEVGQIFFTDASPALRIEQGDVLTVRVKLDAANPPRAIMLQWHSTEHTWAHRAYWGEALLPYDREADGSPRYQRIGDLPATGEWVTLEVPAALVDLAGRSLTGWAFSQFGGRVSWDAPGVKTRRVIDDGRTRFFARWLMVKQGDGGAGLSDAMRATLARPEETWTQAEMEALVVHYLRRVDERTRLTLEPMERELGELDRQIRAIRNRSPRLPVLREVEAANRRATHVLEVGNYLAPKEAVTPDVPEQFSFVTGRAVDSRADLARWLVDPNNPLTARVIVNRIWEQLFGLGIVRTVEDFGMQGEWPSHPELLDHLAVDFQRDWDFKRMLRSIVMSNTYRQTSRITPEKLERDPENRLLARGPRFRLKAEMVRDQALAAAGLLSEKMHGPPVFPPQPEGLWTIIYSGDKWVTSEGEDRYRRALYTFWRRTVPYPSMIMFDAPERFVCTSRRIRTNTPLQAFVTLNDPAFWEAAQALARRVLTEGGATDEARIAHAFRLVVSRSVRPEEVTIVQQLLDDERARFTASKDDAAKVATDPLGPLPEALDIVEAAAWTQVASVLLNLDETLTKE